MSSSEHAAERQYHIGFGPEDLDPGTTIALLSGDPGRSKYIAQTKLTGARQLSDERGLDSFAATLPSGRPVLCATSGMGAPSTSIVINELVQVGITTIIRIGTSGSIQLHVDTGSVVIPSGALCRHGAADDIAPPEYPAAADPFLTVALATAASESNIKHHVGITASVDTFFEGQERTATSANKHLIRRMQGSLEEYVHLGILNYEMEAGTLFKMGGVYGISTGCVLAIIAARHEAEAPDLEVKELAVDNAIKVAIRTADSWERRRQ
jgi:uridine phosphorylase